MKNLEHERIAINAINYMKNNLGQSLTTEDIARHVGYSHYHFVRIFKKETGISPRHFLSALRIEASKQKLFDSKRSILNALLQVGYKSIGTFSSKFKQFVGVSPKTFQTELKQLSSKMLHTNSERTTKLKKNDTPTLMCTVQAPKAFKGWIFIGLFPRPIPDQKPIIGTALHKKRICTFSNVPTGTYYVLAASIKRSLNPRDYLLLDHALRGKAVKPIHITENTTRHVTIHLREPSPLDPPILINLPNLLFEKSKREEIN
ncbi:helix-turn-helix transcriptional regulator [Tenuibacillus multivorans]|uniref:Helix-turn-helix domain-containing protein n=1 Tax=Tenuibacillus multivorans TaxID=237069 RepID=A0A1H0B1Z5_9BACI|nr:AraC family transcriptional regulator [Tenuibacillus multivorans]GEL77561.1 hypothetical protein TMU01_17960 [Tenuibacillus multivorans]SDN39692.1 Helix-turn-helix domain-containing protein [Tenuibacillus multivorans]